MEATIFDWAEMAKYAAGGIVLLLLFARLLMRD